MSSTQIHLNIYQWFLMNIHIIFHNGCTASISTSIIGITSFSIFSLAFFFSLFESNQSNLAEMIPAYAFDLYFLDDSSYGTFCHFCPFIYLFVIFCFLNFICLFEKQTNSGRNKQRFFMYQFILQMPVQLWLGHSDLNPVHSRR